MPKRKQHSPQFKAKLALEALKGLDTTQALAARYGVHPTQISTWKRHLLDGAAEVFAGKRKTRSDDEAHRAELYEQIGRLKMEVEWLKKKTDRLG